MSYSFPYDKYLRDYSDLRHFNKEQAYNHWLEYGIEEERKLVNYNYKDYINLNKDLSNFNKRDAYMHWENCGFKEGRIAKVINVINIKTNITIIIHLFNTELFDEFINYINIVKSVFRNVVVIFTISLNSNFEINIRNINKEFIVLRVENKGVDNYPFIVSIKYLRKNNIKVDYILKLHTKLSINDKEDLLNWRKELIEPIINEQNLIFLYFASFRFSCIIYLPFLHLWNPENSSIWFVISSGILVKLFIIVFILLF
jgi:hypothetical protein